MNWREIWHLKNCLECTFWLKNERERKFSSGLSVKAYKNWHESYCSFDTFSQIKQHNHTNHVIFLVSAINFPKSVVYKFLKMNWEVQLCQEHQSQFSKSIRWIKTKIRSAQGKNQLHCRSNKHFQLLEFHSMTKAFGGRCQNQNQNQNQLSFVSHPKNEWSIWPCPKVVDRVVLKETSFEV